MMDVSPQKLKEEVTGGKSVTIVDLQEAHAYAHSHIPGAVNVPMEGFEKGYADVVKDKDSIVVLYGEYDELGKGSKAGEVLQAAGYEKVGHVVGGLRGWQEAGYPTEGGKES